MARSPDMILRALNKENDRSGKVGAAWKNDDGSISIVLDPFVQLMGKGHGQDVVLTLFPSSSAVGKPRASRPQEDKDDDIPF